MEGTEQVVLAIGVVADPMQHPEVRLRAQGVLDGVKGLASGGKSLDAMARSRNAEALLSLCASLISTPASSKASLECKFFGINVLQQLVIHQWYDLSEEIKQRLSLFIVECCRSLCAMEPGSEATSYPLKSKLAVLFADMSRLMTSDATNSQQQDGVSGSGPSTASDNVIRSKLLPELVTWPGSRGVELACMVLRWLPEGTNQIVPEALSATRKRVLLKALQESLPDILSFVYQALDKHYAALTDNTGNMQECKSVLDAALEMLLRYAEWTPIALFQQYGVIHACGILLRDRRFRHMACDILRQQAGCKVTLSDVTKQQDGSSKQQAGTGKGSIATGFGSVNMMYNNSRNGGGKGGSGSFDATPEEVLVHKTAAKALYGALVGPTEESLSTEYAALGTEEYEFGLTLCETLVLWGRNYMKATLEPDETNLFLRMMIAFFQHPNFNLATPTTEFWSQLLKDTLVQESKEGLGSSAVFPDGFLRALLDVIITRLQKPLLDSLDGYPSEYFESAKQFHEKYALFRQKMIEISKYIVRGRPEEVFQACAFHLDSIFTQVQQAPNQKSLESPLEAATHLLFTATTVTGQSISSQSPSLKNLLQKLLSFPVSVILQSDMLMQFIRCMEALGGNEHTVVPVVQCLLGILSTPAGTAVDQSNSTLASEQGRRAARQQAATTVMCLALQPGAVKILSQHLSALVEQIQGMWSQGLIQPGERNALYEAVVVIATSCGLEEQQKTFEWLFSETCQQWSNPQWQETVMKDTVTFMRGVGISSCHCVAGDPTFNPQKSGKERMRLYHAVQLVERMARRLIILKKKYSSTSPQDQQGTAPSIPNANANGNTATSNLTVALVPHLKWIFPVVLRILRFIHYLASPEGRKMLGPSESALEIGEVERAFLLGITPSGVSPSAYVSATSGSSAPAAGWKHTSSAIVMENDNLDALRTFLRGARDSIYQFLGTATQLSVEDQSIATNLGFSTFFDGMATLVPEIFAVVIEHIQYQDDRTTRMLVRAFICPLVRNCPQNYWAHWMRTLLPPLLQHMHSRLTTGWHAFLVGNQGASSSQTDTTNAANAGGPVVEHGDEIMHDLCVRELTREHLSLMLTISAGDESGNAYFHMQKKKQVKTMLQWLAVDCPQSAACLLATAVAALTWPDSETGSKAIKVCRIALSMSQEPQYASFQPFITKDMLTACISSLTLPSHADFQSEILMVIRDIIVAYSDHVSAILLTLPNIDNQILVSFHQAMKSKGSEKDQRNLVRKLLLRSGGSELKAMAQAHRPGMAIPQLQGADFDKRDQQQNKPGTQNQNAPLLETDEQAPLSNLF
eukprot:CAMPEP_0198240168 /NCGR_PEP_ID=MMETSP1446-20131203/5364_1 /TAXON_ID=1461542 ORGANISM="Unidentified sp, Strain CCMP2111" /NCGR_SAMPLE_ID=MMETSP1446 /ASSEMBLY_ACC=CAM_ASM_001112 /LENGTH=1315 /DNA_ID=CAMNT_0043922867 /DNA_START=165 /DNA_END=4112 /DNA_ORIENTATION=-